METIETTKALKVGQNCTCFNLRKSARAIPRMYDEMLRPTGLLVTQFTLLMASRALEPVTVKRLASELAMDCTTLARNLKLLKKRDYIRIESGEDRREQKVSVTEKGLEALVKAYPFWARAKKGQQQFR
jgi:DNA-binding MarR family transcriptional regulator